MDDTNPVDQSQQTINYAPVDDFMQIPANFLVGQNYPQPVNYNDPNYIQTVEYQQPVDADNRIEPPILENNIDVAPAVLPVDNYAPVLAEQPIYMDPQDANEQERLPRLTTRNDNLGQDVGEQERLPRLSELESVLIAPVENMPVDLYVQGDNSSGQVAIQPDVNLPGLGGTLDYLKTLPTFVPVAQVLPSQMPVPLANNQIITRQKASMIMDGMVPLDPPTMMAPPVIDSSWTENMPARNDGQNGEWKLDNPVAGSRVKPGMTTGIAGMTTELPGITTELPKMTTEMSGMTTELPKRTTGIAGMTTELPGSTTEITGMTTELPKRTTEIAGRTTELPEKMTGIAGMTTGIAGRTKPSWGNGIVLEIAKTLDAPFSGNQPVKFVNNQENDNTEFDISNLDIPEETVRSGLRIYWDSLIFYGRNIFTFLPLSAVGAGGLAISFLPYYILKGYLPALNIHFSGGELWSNLALGFGFIFSLLAVGLPLSSIVSVIVLNNQGKNINFAMAVHVGGRNYWVFLLNFLLYLAGVAMGLFLFIVPGIIIAVHGIFTVFVAFADSLNPGKSFRRSWQLTHYYCWDIWLAMLGIILLAIFAAIGTSYIKIPLVGFSINVLFLPLWLIILYTLYSDVRTAQENRTAQNHWAIWSMLVSLVFSIALVIAAVNYYPKSTISQRMPMIDKIVKANSFLRIINTNFGSMENGRTDFTDNNTTTTKTNSTKNEKKIENVPTGISPIAPVITQTPAIPPTQPVIAPTPTPEIPYEDQPVDEYYPSL